MPASPPTLGTKVSRAKYVDLEVCHRNGMQLVMQGLATVVRVAQSEDLKYALPAGQWLVSYGDGIMREDRAKAQARQAGQKALPGPVDREQILSELRGLYAKALGNSGLIVEAETEPVSPAKS